MGSVCSNELSCGYQWEQLKVRSWPREIGFPSMLKTTFAHVQSGTSGHAQCDNCSHSLDDASRHAQTVTSVLAQNTLLGLPRMALLSLLGIQFWVCSEWHFCMFNLVLLGMLIAVLGLL